jgi:hypothetical protein
VAVHDPLLPRLVGEDSPQVHVISISAQPERTENGFVHLVARAADRGPKVHMNRVASGTQRAHGADSTPENPFGGTTPAGVKQPERAAEGVIQVDRHAVRRGRREQEARARRREPIDLAREKKPGYRSRIQDLDIVAVNLTPHSDGGESESRPEGGIRLQTAAGIAPR